MEQLNEQQTFTVTAEVHVHADEVRKLLCMCMHPKSLLLFSILTSVINNIFLLQYLAETTGLIDALSPSLLQVKQCTTATATMTWAQAKRVQELSRDVSIKARG